MKTISLNSFKNMSREDMRKTAGGANLCHDDCSSDGVCQQIQSNSYCGHMTCHVKGNLTVGIRSCQYVGGGTP